MANPQQQDPDFIPAEQSPDFIPASGASMPQGSVPAKDLPGSTPRLRQAAMNIPSSFSTPTQFEKERGGGSALGSFAKDIGGMVANLPTVASDPTAIAGAAPQMAAHMVASDFGRSDRGIPYRAAAAIATPFADVEGMEDDAEHGRTGSIVGHMAAGMAPAALPLATELHRSLPVPTPEESARLVTKAINPPVQDWNNFIGNLTEQGGNIKAFGQKNNNPFKTQMDFANASRGMADEAKAHWDKVIGPHEGEQLSIAGSGYQGRTIGEGQRATLGDILDRIDVINNELRPAFNKREVGQTLTALQQSQLNHELASLKATVNDALGAKTGLDADQITALRKRYGGGYSIADQTTAAWNQRQSSAGKASEGRRDVPLTTASWLSEGINKLKGGAEGIGNRNFRKAFEPAQFSSSDLPTPTAPSMMPPSREPLWKKVGVEPTKPSDFFTEESEAPKQQRRGK